MNAIAQPELDALLERLTTLLEVSDYAQAAHLAEQALPQHPASAELVRLQSIALRQLGQRDEARQALLRAEQLSPETLEIQCNLASLETAEGQADQAIERMRAALRRSPGHPMILLILGNALMAAARYAQARESFAMATHGAPAHPGLRLNLAAVELELDHPEQAAVHAEEALQIAPRMGAGYAMLGHTHRVRRQYAEAARAYLRAEQLEPGQSEHAYHAGLMLNALDRLDDAQAALARAVRLDPTNGPALSQRVFALRRLCDWRELESLSERLRNGVAASMPGIAPFAFLLEDATPAEQRRCAETFTATIEQQMAPLRRQLALSHSAPAADAPIRIGFVSNGFGEHPIGSLTVALFEALKRSELEVHLYATAPADSGPLHRRLQAATRFHQVDALGQAALAQQIHSDGIEVLVDLGVYGDGSNAELFALRPAPLQLNWLGYPGTSGAPWIDYLLADTVLVPDRLREAYSEKLVRLPRCYQPSDIHRTIPEAPSREACGLPASGTVFACFNASHKITPQAFARFMAILTRSPDSVLWLLSGPQEVDRRLREQARLAGVAEERLIFMPKLAQPDYLARYQRVDLFLDTLPYNAHATASDALWAGCPVLTCIGESFAGRLAASLLLHAGLPELVAEDEPAFVAMAVHLGSHHEALQLLRHHLVQRSADLFDMDGYASDFQRAIQAMVARRRSEQPAADIDL
jgi:predicted O-linked N-acetylglucosamine transferase (SPINDLY family)